MQTIENAPYGIRIIFSGAVLVDEMTEWLYEFQELMAKKHEAFGVLVDMRTMLPLADDAVKILQAGQRAARNKGMNRSVVLLSSAVVTMQLKRIAQSTGIYQWERYIDTSQNEQW